MSASLLERLADVMRSSGELKVRAVAAATIWTLAEVSAWYDYLTDDVCGSDARATVMRARGGERGERGASAQNAHTKANMKM